jgi:hydrogenase maturation factor
MTGPCRDDVCLTCSDEALPAVVVGLGADELALVRLAGADGESEVSVALVDACVGDTILVHAGEAIAVVDRVTAAVHNEH